MCIAIAIYAGDAFVCYPCCYWSILRFFPSFGLQVMVCSFVLHCMRIVFDKKSLVFESENSRQRVKKTLRVCIFILFSSASGDLSMKYKLGCTPEFYCPDICLFN